MIPNITRGGDADGLLRYLLGPGRARAGESGQEVHTDPHLIAASPEALLEHGTGILAVGDAGALARFVDEPRRAFGTEVLIAERDADGRTVSSRPGHVWHCSLSLHPGEPAQSDERWGEIATAFVARMGFADPEALRQCRWVAVRHGPSAGGNDHVHVVVGLVSEDGSRAGVHNDRPRAQRTCRQLEAEFGLRVVESRGRGAGERGLRPGELEADLRRGVCAEGQDAGQAGSRRRLERIVRACAAAAGTEPEFVALLRRHEVLVRPRYAQGETREVVGFSAALRPGEGERPVWFGGGRLSRELTLPRLRETWEPCEDSERLTAWSTFSDRLGTSSPLPISAQLRCANELGELRERLERIPASETEAWADLAREAAGVYAAWSLRTEPVPGPLARTSRALARSAQLRRGPAAAARARPAATRRATRLLLGQGLEARAAVRVFVELSRLTRAIADMREARGELARVLELEDTGRHELLGVGERLSALAGRPEAPGAALTPGQRLSGARRTHDMERDSPR